MKFFENLRNVHFYFRLYISPNVEHKHLILTSTPFSVFHLTIQHRYSRTYRCCYDCRSYDRRWIYARHTCTVSNNIDRNPTVKKKYSKSRTYTFHYLPPLWEQLFSVPRFSSLFFQFAQRFHRLQPRRSSCLSKSQKVRNQIHGNMSALPDVLEESQEKDTQRRGFIRRTIPAINRRIFCNPHEPYPHSSNSCYGNTQTYRLFRTIQRRLRLPPSSCRRSRPIDNSNQNHSTP